MIDEATFKAFGQEPKFQKLFVFKGDAQVVHYLPKKMKEGGPNNGSRPKRVASIVRSVEMGPAVYPEIEEQLLKVQLSDPRG